MDSPKQKRRGNILLVIASLALSAILAELSSRMLGPVDYRRPLLRMPGDVWRELLHRPSDVPGLAYELAPNMRKRARNTLIKTNSAGMRDRELPIEKGDSTVRIAAIGDSVTFGFGLLSEYTYPKALERLLNGQDEGFGLRFEVLNFVVADFGISQSYLY